MIPRNVTFYSGDEKSGKNINECDNTPCGAEYYILIIYSDNIFIMVMAI